MTPQLRLLVVTKNDFTLERDGGSQRVAAIVRELESRGHTVEYVATRPYASSLKAPGAKTSLGARIAALRVLVRAFRTASLGVLKWTSLRAAAQVWHINRTWAPHVVLIEFSQLAPYSSLLDDQPKLIDLHNIESVLLANYGVSASTLLRRIVARYESAVMAKIEFGLADQFDALSFVSDTDREALGARVPDAMAVIAPNGVREECFHATASHNGKVVFVGHLGWRPNIDAAQWLAREVWPIVRVHAPDASLQLIGRSPDQSVWDLRCDDIEVIPDVPSTVPFVAAASVATAPLLAAGGTRLKILEALASGTPVVATSLGALGLTHLDPGVLLVRDAPAAFAQSIVDQLQRPSTRDACRTAVAGYRWSDALGELVGRVESLASGMKCRGDDEY